MSRMNDTSLIEKCNEVAPSGKEETRNKSETVTGEVNHLDSLGSQCAVTGLSYVGSQEPGELSQAIALDTVNMLVSDNEVGSPHEIDSGTELATLPPILSAKGAQTLARKVDHINTFSKSGIFDWSDSLEDEENDDYFTKRIGLFPDNRGDELGSSSHFVEPRHLSSGDITGAVDKHSEKEDLHLNFYPKINSLAHADSGSTPGNSIQSERLHLSEAETKNLYMDTGEQSRSLEQQLELTDDGEVEVEYCVGPDTQMAAEAMEALFHGFPINHDLKEDAHPIAGNSIEDASRDMTMMKAFSKDVVVRKKASSSHDPKDIVLSRGKVPHSGFGRVNPRPSREHSSSSTVGNKLATGKQKVKKEKRKVDGHLNVGTSLTTSKSTISLKRNKAWGTVDEIFAKECNKVHNSMTIITQLSVSKELAQSVHHVTSGASRVRYSKSKNSSKGTETSACNYGRLNTGLRMEEGKLASDSSGPLRCRRKDRNKHLTQRIKSQINMTSHSALQVIQEQHEEELKSSSLTEDVFSHPRWKRTHHITREDLNNESGRNIPTHSNLQVIEEHHEEETKTSSLINDVFIHPRRKRTCHIRRVDLNNANLNKPSVSGVNVPETVMQPHIRQTMIEVIVKSLPEIQDTATWKKGTVSTHFLSENGGAPFSTREVPAISCASTRLSASSPSFKTHLEKDSKLCFNKPLFCEAGTTDSTSYSATAVKNHRVPLTEMTLPNRAANSFSHSEDTKRNAKLEGSPKDKAQSFGLVRATLFKKENGNAKLEGSPKDKAQSFGLVRATLFKKENAVSPQSPPKTSFNKRSVNSSNTRELIRLKDTESVSTRSLRELRRRKDLASVRVLFSNNLDEDIIKKQKKILARLGVLVAPSISDATHFVTDKFARTRNMLEAIAMGKPVVTHIWLECCGQAGCYIDERKYILRDLKKEKETGFSMPISLARACQCPLLQGRRVLITRNIKPDRELVASLVKAAHGQPIERLGRIAMNSREVPDDLLVISCEEDYAVCTRLLEKGAEIFSSELLLNGIVIQKLEFERHRLSFNHVKRATQYG